MLTRGKTTIYDRNGGCTKAGVADECRPMVDGTSTVEPLLNVRWNADSTPGAGHRRILSWLLAALLGTGACSSEPNGPPAVPPPVLPTEELTFLRQSGSAPALLTADTSLVATRGEAFRLRLFYEPEPGSSSTEGERFLELEWDDDSLAEYPPGHPMAGQAFVDGDTITIRVSVEPSLLIASLEPSGIVFDPDAPAELEIRYVNADDDYDQDGSPDPEDEDLIDLWRQEDPGDPWTRIGELKDLDQDRIRATLVSFSRYALAF